MYRRILIPTDGSGPSEVAVKAGLELARNLKAEATLLYVLEGATRHTWVVPETVPYFPDLERDIETAGKQALERAAGFAAEMGVAARSELVKGRAPEVIVDQASQHDLVVMGTHGRSGLDLVLLGSVTQKVLQQSPKPVLVVRQPGDKPS
jgi:nucleotide-binding universal stress UspA family protein